MPDDVKYPRYLGDSVYVRVKGGMVNLYLNNGEGDHTEIYLEVETLDAFLEWLKDLRVRMIAEREKKDA